MHNTTRDITCKFQKPKNQCHNIIERDNMLSKLGVIINFDNEFIRTRQRDRRANKTTETTV